MNQIDSNFLSIDYRIESIKNILTSGQVTNEEIADLAEEIYNFDHTHLNTLQREKLVYLAQHLNELSLSNEMKNITDGAHLISGLEDVQNQKLRIQNFIGHHSLSIEQRKQINQTYSTLSQQEEAIRNKTDDFVIPKISFNELFHRETSDKVVSLQSVQNPLDPIEKQELAFELFDMAALLNDGKVKEFFTHYNQLPLQIKEKYSIFAQETGGDISALASQQDVSTIHGNILHIIRALIGLAHEITDSSLLTKIPSIEDVQQIFEDLQFIKEND